MQRFEKLRQVTDGFLAMGVPYNDCIVMQHGQCVYRHFGGYTDPENGIAPTGRERYNIYSCSKLFTCVAAMQLWEEGAFSLQDMLSDFLPEFSEMLVKCGGTVRKCEKPIHIRHLFEMTAGLNYYFDPSLLRELREKTGGKCPTREAIRYLARQPLDFEPGDHWQYSYAHDVLACLVEVLSGQRFGEYVKSHIFDRVGMPDTTFLLPEEELNSIAPQYCYDAEKQEAVRIAPEIESMYKLGSEYESGGAGAVSTVEDYIRFMEALRTGEMLLRRDTIRLMATNRLNEKQRETYWQKTTHGYGLGLRCPQENGRYPDFGWGGKAGAYLAIDPVNELTLYYAQHMLYAPNNQIKGRVYKAVWDELRNNG